MTTHFDPPGVSRRPLVSPDPIDLLEATVRFTLDVVLAQNPALHLPPSVPLLRPPACLAPAREIVDLAFALLDSLDRYRVLRRPAPPVLPVPGPDDDPF